MWRSLEEIGALIRTWREEAGLTQQALADQLGMGRGGQQQLNKYETGKRRPSASRMAKIAELFGKQATAFMADGDARGEAVAVAVGAGSSGPAWADTEVRDIVRVSRKADPYEWIKAAYGVAADRRVGREVFAGVDRWRDVTLMMQEDNGSPGSDQ